MKITIINIYMVEEDRSNLQTLNRKALNDDKMFLIYIPYL